MSQYQRELPSFPPLFNYPLFAPPIELDGELIYDARHCAAFFLYQASLQETKAINITLELIKEANSKIDVIQLFNQFEVAGALNTIDEWGKHSYSQTKGR
ncbi:hypothetical protein H6F76_02160 [Leptolyngbya sp. FACHB-321]|uniref:hypothetical protein n=1 Tax=Leptolyngbya sp. FACHB-321 TaxID=2692807 RepID=UPI001686B8B3|nr:hypothetical protein [Leptolyngbya sp. FACHB-321]MBD2033857.1 hypothetical protein [Leptolyngbya sp. FACHB-321]